MKRANEANQPSARVRGGRVKPSTCDVFERTLCFEKNEGKVRQCGLVATFRVETLLKRAQCARNVSHK